MSGKRYSSVWDALCDSRDEAERMKLRSAYRMIEELRYENTRLRARLEKLEGQEPVAYITPRSLHVGEANFILAEDVPENNKKYMTPLYTAPPAGRSEDGEEP